MSLLSENVIPGNHGKIFSTNAKDLTSLLKIKKVILQLEGVKEVILNEDAFPREFIIHTSKLVSVESIENEVKKLGFHAIPKGLFEL
jgi:hypothetical protein|tara:strand:- start:5 stop:265 length:261 start_codon:yes stop_codon:yes gene_type:complete